MNEPTPTPDNEPQAAPALSALDALDAMLAALDKLADTFDTVNAELKKVLT